MHLHRASRTWQTTLALLVASAPTIAAGRSGKDTQAPVVTHRPCAEYGTGRAFEIVALIKDSSPLFDPKVIYRSPSNGEWKTVPLNQDGRSETYRAKIPAKHLNGPLDYFIEVFDQMGNGPARFASADEPARAWPAAEPQPCQQVGGPQGSTTITATPAPTASTGPVATAPSAAADPGAPLPADLTSAPPPPADTSACAATDRPLYCEWWLWAIIGGVVVAGGAVTIAVVSSSGGEVPSQAMIHVTSQPPTQAP